MIIYFVTFISCILFYKYSLPIEPFPSWGKEMRLFSFYLWQYFSIIKNVFSFNFTSKTASEKTKKKSFRKSKTLAMKSMETTGSKLMDLPDLALDLIVEKLEPLDLCRMACVSTQFRDMCSSDYFWKTHMKQKWGRIIGANALKEWQWYAAFNKESKNYFLDGGEGKGFLMSYLSKLLRPVLMLKSSFNGRRKTRVSSQPRDGCSIVSFYRALETGKFWFPAQVFNRENGHVGFVMSCYDAELSYDSKTDTFEARYPPHGARAVAAETGVAWERLRAPPIDASPHDLLVSDCLYDLRPKDHIEIQWRRNKHFPYGWWYGVIGHLESCDGNVTYCRCHESDTVVLEFKQYARGSRWRHMTISRKDHREEGNETEGFYGGIRKLYNKDEISMWQQFWPTDILE